MSSPSPVVMILGSTKTPKDELYMFPIRVGWYEWRNAVVPVLEDESLDPDSQANVMLSKHEYIGIIERNLLESYVRIKALPDSFL